MKKLIIISICIFGILCKKETSVKTEEILKTYFSQDKKLKIEIADSKTDPQCENQPSSLFDNQNRSRFCYFRIINNDSNKVLYEISALDEYSEKKNNKCFPSTFPLAIAYGFDKFFDNENIIFTESYAWYAADDENITTYKFNWNTCEKTKLFNLTDEHVTIPENDKIITVFANDFYYSLHFFGKEGTITVGKLSKEIVESFDNKVEPFYLDSNDENPYFLYKENINIVFKEKSSSLYFENYKYPYLKIKFTDKIFTFDVRKDLF